MQFSCTYVNPARPECPRRPQGRARPRPGRGRLGTACIEDGTDRAHGQRASHACA